MYSLERTDSLAQSRRRTIHVLSATMSTVHLMVGQSLTSGARAHDFSKLSREYVIVSFELYLGGTLGRLGVGVLVCTRVGGLQHPLRKKRVQDACGLSEASDQTSYFMTAMCLDTLVLALIVHVRVLLAFQQPNNLRFKTTQTINDVSAAHDVVYVVSSELLKCRLLK